MSSNNRYPLISPMFSETPQAKNYQPANHDNSYTNPDNNPTRPIDPLPNENVVNNTILKNTIL